MSDHDCVWNDVGREATHHWLDEREAPDRPSPGEYLEPEPPRRAAAVAAPLYRTQPPQEAER